MTIALMVNAKPVNEVHVMRKVVIDGSTPSGFQRTTVVALNGEITVGGRKVPIQTICVEEDACRKTGEKDATVYYRLDRLGAPLIEVVTAPVITSPEEAEEVALALGQILRATGRAKRGIGTIRQDLNISIRGGGLSEVKGVQELELVSEVVTFEVQRQLTLLKIRDKLREKGLKEEDLEVDVRDITDVLKGSKCRVIQTAIERRGRVIAIVLPGLSGLLGIELMPKMSFGTELSDYAKFWGGVEGIFHTDELPTFGITKEEVTMLRSFLNTAEGDAIILVAARGENALDALKAVKERMKTAIVGVPNETRSAYPDGTTHYSRPRPGAARMYPETDVPPVSITEETLKKIREHLPEPTEAKLSRLMKEYGLNKKLAVQVLNSDYSIVFETVACKTRVTPSFIAATLTETFKDMERKGVDFSLLSDNLIESIFALVDLGVVAKEAIPEVLKWMVEHEGTKLEDAVKSLGLAMVSEVEEIAIVEKVIRDNEALIRERGTGALGPLMGVIMKEMRGKIDAKRVSLLIKMRIVKMIKR